MLSHLLDALTGLPGPLVLVLVGALVFGESAFFLGFVLPGETAVLLGGFLSSTGHVTLTGLLVVVVLAAVVGDTVGYEVGRHFGTRALDWRLLRRHRRRVEGARRFLDGRGASAVFVGRFTAFLRAVVPGLAGLSRMRYRRFLAYNAAGGLVWGTGVVLLGHFAGSSYRQVEHWIGRSGAVVAALAIVAALLVWRRRRHTRRDQQDSDAVDGQPVPQVEGHLS